MKTYTPTSGEFLQFIVEHGVAEDVEVSMALEILELRFLLKNIADELGLLTESSHSLIRFFPELTRDELESVSWRLKQI